MKRYEWFNSLTKEARSPEMQAVGMLVADLEETYGFKTNIELEVTKYEVMLGWLNEEVEG